MAEMDINRFMTKKIKEGCVDISVDHSVINFDELRKELYSQLRSVDFVRLIGSGKEIMLIEISDLHRKIKDMKKLYANCDEETIEKIIKEFIKAEFREKLFESLFLIQKEGIVDISPEKVVKFLIVTCNSNPLMFEYLRSFINTITPKNWAAFVLSAKGLENRL